MNAAEKTKEGREQGFIRSHPEPDGIPKTDLFIKIFFTVSSDLNAAVPLVSQLQQATPLHFTE